jgi:hypothetical protein
MPTSCYSMGCCHDKIEARHRGGDYQPRAELALGDKHWKRFESQGSLVGSIERRRILTKQLTNVPSRVRLFFRWLGVPDPETPGISVLSVICDRVAPMPGEQVTDFCACQTIR